MFSGYNQSSIDFWVTFTSLYIINKSNSKSPQNHLLRLFMIWTFDRLRRSSTGFYKSLLPIFPSSSSLSCSLCFPPSCCGMCQLTRCCWLTHNIFLERTMEQIPFGQLFLSSVGLNHFNLVGCKIKKQASGLTNLCFIQLMITFLF